MADPTWYSTGKLARSENVSNVTTWRWAAVDGLGYRCGGRWRFTPLAVELLRQGLPLKVIAERVRADAARNA